MKKHTYRAQKVNHINWQQVQEQTTGAPLVLAVDVAKVQQYALLTHQEHTQSWLMQWSHLEHTPYLIEQLKALQVGAHYRGAGIDQYLWRLIEVSVPPSRICNLPG